MVDASKKVAGFTSHVNRLKSTLSSIKPAIDDIEKVNIILDRPPHETEAFTARLIEAEQLLRRCSKVRKLETSLWNFFHFNVAALHLCETKRVSVVVSDLQEKLNEIATFMHNKSEIHEGMVVEEINDEISSVVRD